MLKISKMFFLSIFLLSATGCLYKPFQPPPSGYVEWIQKNVGHQGIKKAMRDCGYEHIYSSPEARVTNEDTARRQNCMFKNGFRFDDGYKGICSLPDAEKIAACRNSAGTQIRN